MSQMPPDPPVGPRRRGAPPGYGQPGPDLVTGPPRRGMSTGLKALVAGGVVVILTVVAFLAFGGGDEADPNSPVGAAEAFFQASARHDCDAMAGLMTEELLSGDGAPAGEQTLASCEASAGMGADEGLTPDDVDLDLELASESGDTAVVDLTTNFMGESTTTSVELVREGGRWKVNSFLDPGSAAGG